jgi:DNA end-binding protein Ku
MAARSVWKGSIKFSVIQIPSKFFNATESIKSVGLHQLCPDCQGRINQKIVCPTCLDEANRPKEMERSRLLKGYELSDGKNIILTEEDIKAAEKEKSDTIDIITFINRDDIPPIYYSDSLYISPEKVGVDLFALFRTAMEETKTVAVGKVTMRNKENLILIAPHKQYMIGYILYYQEQIRSLEDVPGSDLLGKASIDKNLLGMVTTLIDSLRKPFEPADYKDEYKAVIMAAIERKANPGAVEEIPAQAPKPTKAQSLAYLLQTAIVQAQAQAESGRAKRVVDMDMEKAA